jgi:putative DNA methylase
MAVVAEGARGRVYLAPTKEMETLATRTEPSWKPELSLPDDPRNFWTVNYGLTTYADLFTPRQLVALTTFSDLVQEARERVRNDARAVGMPDDSVTVGATAYADAVATYLAFVVGKLADKGSTICTWNAGPVSSRTASGRSAAVATVRSTFGRQALQMTWDFAEVNFFSESTGSIDTVLGTLTVPLQYLPTLAQPGTATQADAVASAGVAGAIVSTDPPYYDNIAYADLSDFFYIWLRRSLKAVFPDLFATLAVPKAEELVASPYRHGNKEKAEAFFLDGMTKAMHRLAEQAHPAFPVTIYYAFKQSENESDAGTSSTGWETFLDAVIRASFAICGTWPMRTERGARSIGIGTNALASSIVLVCRRRPADALTVSRRDFLRELNTVLPEALDEMTKGSGDDRSPVAPVDLSQAIIGPGMAVFSKYAAVLEANGDPMSVRTALQLINRFLAEDDFDRDTQFCLHWFGQNGWKEGRFGDADTLSRAKGTSVDGVKEAGVVASGGGVVRLLKWSEYPSDWDPKTDTRNPVWETLHHLIRALKRDGESGAGRLLAAVMGQGESVRQLAYRLYTLCERQGWAEDARAYNELITSWTGIESAAGAGPTEKQGDLFDGTRKT